MDLSHQDFWDPRYFLPKLKVRAKSGKIIPFNLWSHQEILSAAVRRCYAEGKWLCHVKPRQEGSSTFFTGVLYQHVAFRRGCYGGIVAHRREAAEKLARMAVRFHQTCPKDVRPYKTPGLKRTLEFPRDDGGDSLLSIASIKDDEPLRGDTAQAVLATEISSWKGKAGEAAWSSVLSAVPEEGGILFGESTPKYYGDQLHQVFEDSHKPGSKWLSVFIPWTLVQEYSKQPPVKWFPRPEIAEYAHKNGLTPGQAFWMQTVGLPRCRNKMQVFHAEYPINEVDCFGLAGDPIFDIDILMEKLRAMDLGTGLAGETKELEVFQGPARDEQYIIAVDPASSWSKKDMFGFEIVSLTTCEQVAEFQGYSEAHAMAKMLADLGKKYNNATIYVEANGVGDSLLSHLLSPPIEYRYVFHRTASNVVKRSGGGSQVPGWWSSTSSKAAATGYLQEMISDGSFVLHSQRLIRQLVQYRGQWDKSSRDQEGGHFDLVSAIAIAAWAYRNEVSRGNIKAKKTKEQVVRAAWDRLLLNIEGSSDSSWNTRWGNHR